LEKEGSFFLIVGGGGGKFREEKEMKGRIRNYGENGLGEK